MNLFRRMRTYLVVLILLFTSVCFGGMEQEFACRKCGLKGRYISGNLMTAEQRVAFCRNKDHLVSISWEYRKRPPKPVRVEAGVPVYLCPICRTPTVRLWDEAACPRCGSKKFKIRETGMAVD